MLVISIHSMPLGFEGAEQELTLLFRCLSSPYSSCYGIMASSRLPDRRLDLLLVYLSMLLITVCIEMFQYYSRLADYV